MGSNVSSTILLNPPNCPPNIILLVWQFVYLPHGHHFGGFDGSYILLYLLFYFPLSFFQIINLFSSHASFFSKMHSRTWGNTQAPWNLLETNMCRFLFTCENLSSVPSPLKHPNPFLLKVYKCFSTIIMFIGVILKWYARIKDIFSHPFKSNFILFLDGRHRPHAYRYNVFFSIMIGFETNGTMPHFLLNI